jgi:hypothetical protein
MTKRVAFGMAGAAVCAAVAGMPAIGGPAPRPPDSKSQTAAHFEMQSRTGTLKKYRLGRSIVLTEPGGRQRTLALDPAARVDRNLKKGQQVNVISMTDEAGKERVSAIARTGGSPEPVPAAGGSANHSPER